MSFTYPAMAAGLAVLWMRQPRALRLQGARGRSADCVPHC